MKQNCKWKFIRNRFYDFFCHSLYSWRWSGRNPMDWFQKCLQILELFCLGVHYCGRIEKKISSTFGPHLKTIQTINSSIRPIPNIRPNIRPTSANIIRPNIRPWWPIPLSWRKYAVFCPISRKFSSNFAHFLFKFFGTGSFLLKLFWKRVYNYLTSFQMSPSKKLNQRYFSASKNFQNGY